MMVFDIVYFYRVGAQKARMFPQPRFSYLTSALTAARQLLATEGHRPGDAEYYQRVRDLNVNLYRAERASGR
jgi:hypothetical protein